MYIYVWIYIYIYIYVTIFKGPEFRVDTSAGLPPPLCFTSCTEPKVLHGSQKDKIDFFVANISWRILLPVLFESQGCGCRIFFCFCLIRAHAQTLQLLQLLPWQSKLGFINCFVGNFNFETETRRFNCHQLLEIHTFSLNRQTHGGFEVVELVDFEANSGVEVWEDQDLRALSTLRRDFSFFCLLCACTCVRMMCA